MTLTGRLVALGLGAAAVFAVATLPASLLVTRLESHGLQATGVAGSIWNARIASLAWRGTPLGSVHWRVGLRPLLRGRLGGHVELGRPDGRLTAEIGVSPGGEIHVAAARATLPLEAFAALPTGLPKGWRGRLQANVDELVLSKGLPVRARGSLDVDDLVAPPPRNAAIGSYRLVLPDPRTPDAVGLSARIADKSGPLGVDARLTVAPDRSFLLEGTVLARPDLPQAMQRSMEILGPADAQGRRPFSVGGTL